MYFTHPQFKKFNLKPFFAKYSESELREKLAKFFPNFHIIFTDSGRSAFQIAIKELGLGNSEILIPAYICDIFLPIFKKYNIKPIYLDIDFNTFHLKISEIEEKITPQTKSILICHTYGLPVKIDKILEISQKYNLKIIEDCAHIFPSKISGDCAFLSFSKLCPTIDGGMLVSRKNPDNLLLNKFSSQASNFIKFLRLFPCLAELSERFRRSEKTLATKEFSSPRQPSKQSLRIFNWYLDNFNKQIKKRIDLAKYFQQELKKLGFEIQEAQDNNFTYLSALVPKNLDRNKLFIKLRKKHIFCSRIWRNPIFPNLPNTSEIARRVINFPLQNWFTKKDINKIISGILSDKD